MKRLAMSRKGLPRAERPTLSATECVRGHSLALHGKRDTSGYVRCAVCLRASRQRYEQERRTERRQS